MATLPFKTRKAIVLRHPRIESVEGFAVCTAYKWSRMPMKAVWSDMRGYDPSLKEKYRCKKPGRFAFTALRSGDAFRRATDGTYCWDHLVQQIMGHPDEDKAFDKWWERQPEVIAWRQENPETPKTATNSGG